MFLAVRELYLYLSSTFRWRRYRTCRWLTDNFEAHSLQTVSSLGSFFLAMVLYPEFQERAQREIDEVCHGRLPDFTDRHDLPYVEALVKESLRWNPVIPLGGCP